MTYEEAKKITEETEVFYEKIEEVITPKGNSYYVSLFNYMLAMGEDFKKYKANELRGLSFIHYPTENGIEYIKNLMLPKFFNLNENKYVLYNTYKDKEIKSISLKEDGSLLQPIRFPDGSIVWKTKMSFDNEQTRMATEYFNNPKNKNLKEYIENFVDDYVLLFELVSPLNKIVISYKNTELRLLTTRDRFLGGWGYPITTNNIMYDSLGIKTAIQLRIPKKVLKVNKEWYYNFLGEPQKKDRKTFNTFQLFLDAIEYELILRFPEEMKEYKNEEEKNKDKSKCKLKNKISELDLLILSRDYIMEEEGFVVTFNDLSKCKIKHQNYIEKHKLNEEIERENRIIQRILEENIDDVLSQLEMGDEKRELIEKIQEKVSKYFDNRIEGAMKLRAELFNVYNVITKEEGEEKVSMDLPNFTKKRGRDENFHIVMKTKKMSFKEDFRERMSTLIKEEIMFKTRKLEMAREFLKKI